MIEIDKASFVVLLVLSCLSIPALIAALIFWGDWTDEKRNSEYYRQLSLQRGREIRELHDIICPPCPNPDKGKTPRVVEETLMEAFEQL